MSAAGDSAQFFSSSTLRARVCGCNKGKVLSSYCFWQETVKQINSFVVSLTGLAFKLRKNLYTMGYTWIQTVINAIVSTSFSLWRPLAVYMLPVEVELPTLHSEVSRDGSRAFVDASTIFWCTKVSAWELRSTLSTEVASIRTTSHLSMFIAPHLRQKSLALALHIISWFGSDINMWTPVGSCGVAQSD